MTLLSSGRRSERGAGLLFALVALTAGACAGDKPAPVKRTIADSVQAVRDSIHADSIVIAKRDSITRSQPGYVIDSILAPDEELRRFREKIGGPPATRLIGGSSTRDSLVRRFISAVARKDTNDLRAMAVHAREYADLYYPESPYAKPPYHQPPDFSWRQIQDPSSRGLTKLINRLGGTRLEYVSSVCEDKVLREGKVRRYSGCLVRVVLPTGDKATKRYFGSIIERDGQFKFLSYTNDF